MLWKVHPRKTRNYERDRGWSEKPSRDITVHLLRSPGGDGKENGGGHIWRDNYWEFLKTDKDENPHISEAQQIPSSITFKTHIDTS